jgi:pSer/pThr/pTyr-binding forkhead associated (FHA) protein
MACLKITSGAQSGRQFDIDRNEISIGRIPDNVIALDDPSASSRHCLVIRDGRKYTLRDLGSTNGTYLNGNRIREARLKPQDVFMAGAIEILFDGDDVDVPEPSEDTSSIRETVRIDSIPESVRPGALPFEVRRSRKGLWLTVTAVVALALIALTAFFIAQLSGAK